VRRGQFIARVGDSGNSDEPHLHIQVQNRESFDIDDPGLRSYPILFHDVELRRGNEAFTPVEAHLRLGDRVRRLE
jgi:murein DD-endopeptidase MepM/ murein hydrolase activator NlpD